jgi:two-component system chemotaxis response regulator CheB
MKKKILIVDDSALMRRIECDIINSDDNFEVSDICRDGQAALEKLRTEKYDCVILDVNMPKMDGLQLLEQLHKEKIAVTVIMVSTLTKGGADVTMRCMDMGAAEFVTKPENIIEAKGAEFKNRLLCTINSVLKTGNTRKMFVEAENKPDVHKVEPVKVHPGRSKLVALACSTGGPKALQSVIPYLPKNMDAPMVLVQHMPASFTKTMANRLNDLSELSVKEAEEGDILMKGWVYVAPGGKHLHVEKDPRGGHRIHLGDEPAIGGLKPCADIMYHSLERSGFDEITCVVLTGMGSDGTKGINGLKSHKRLYTIAQDKDTCVVYGMPKAVAESGVVDEVVPLDDIANTIIKNVGVR